MGINYSSIVSELIPNVSMQVISSYMNLYNNAKENNNLHVIYSNSKVNPKENIKHLDTDNKHLERLLTSEGLEAIVNYIIEIIDYNDFAFSFALPWSYDTNSTFEEILYDKYRNISNNLYYNITSYISFRIIDCLNFILDKNYPFYWDKLIAGDNPLGLEISHASYIRNCASLYLFTIFLDKKATDNMLSQIASSFSNSTNIVLQASIAAIYLHENNFKELNKLFINNRKYMNYCYKVKLYFLYSSNNISISNANRKEYETILSNWIEFMPEEIPMDLLKNNLDKFLAYDIKRAIDIIKSLLTAGKLRDETARDYLLDTLFYTIEHSPLKNLDFTYILNFINNISDPQKDSVYSRISASYKNISYNLSDPLNSTINPDLYYNNLNRLHYLYKILIYYMDIDNTIPNNYEENIILLKNAVEIYKKISPSFFKN